MPITKSAKKSLRVSQTKKAQNRTRKIALDKALKAVNNDNISSTIALIDKAAKTGIIHKNKASRMKSQLSKKFSTPKQEKPKAKVQKSESKTAKITAKSEPKAKKTADKKPAAKKTIKK